MQNTQENTALVLFRVGPVLCCAPAQPVLSIIAPPKLTHTPGSTDARPGIFHHSEHVVQVSDLRVRFGISESQRKQPGRLIITQQENGHVAFWVDDIIEVIQSPKVGWGKLPAYIPPGIFSRTLLLNDQIHLYVEIENLDELPDENYLSQYLQQFEPAETETPEVVSESDEQEGTESGEVAAEIEQAAEQPFTPAEPVKADEPAPTRTDDIVSTTNAKVGPLARTDAETRTPTATTVSEPQTNITATKPETKSSPQREELEPAQAVVETTPVEKTAEPEEPITLLPKEPEPEPKSDPEPEPVAEPPVSEQPVVPEVKTKSAVLSNTVVTEQTEQPAAAQQQKTVPPYELSQNHELIPPEKKAAKPEPKSRVGLIAASILLLISAVAGYVLLTPDGQALRHPSVAAPSDKPVPVSTDVATADTSEPEQSPEAISPETYSAEQPDLATTPSQDESSEPEGKDEDETKTDSANYDYHAKIKQDAQGFTIELAAPDNEEVLSKRESSETEVEQEPERKISPKRNKKSKPAIREITHIVIEGDTLWDIAEHYVNNPYKYSELASLSNIEDPDLIFPGDRVRIIHKSANR